MRGRALGKIGMRVARQAAADLEHLFATLGRTFDSLSRLEILKWLARRQQILADGADFDGLKLVGHRQSFTVQVIVLPEELRHFSARTESMWVFDPIVKECKAVFGCHVPQAGTHFAE